MYYIIYKIILLFIHGYGSNLSSHIYTFTTLRNELFIFDHNIIYYLFIIYYFLCNYTYNALHRQHNFKLKNLLGEWFAVQPVIVFDGFSLN